MKYVFYDKTENQKNLIINALDSICVPYKVEAKTSYSVFGPDTTYNVNIDVDLKYNEAGIEVGLQFVLNQVNAYLSLEKSYEGRDAIHPEKKCAFDTTQHYFQNTMNPKPSVMSYDEVQKMIDKAENNNFDIVDNIFNSIKNIFRRHKIKKVANQEEKETEHLVKAGLVSGVDGRDKRSNESWHDYLERKLRESLDSILKLEDLNKSLDMLWLSDKRKEVLPKIFSDADMISASPMTDDTMKNLDNDIKGMTNKIYTYDELPESIKVIILTGVGALKSVEELKKSRFRIQAQKGAIGMGLKIEVIED